jgi:type IV secretion system protein VirB1
MIYAVAAIATLAQQCAPEIATEAVVPLVMTESSGDSSRSTSTRGRAFVPAPSLKAQRSSVAMSLLATPSMSAWPRSIRPISRLGVSVEEVFDPCTNLRLASAVLQEGYGLATRHYTGLDAISATYSLYNTGTLTRGFRNGYVGRVWSAAAALGSVQAPPALPVPSTPASDTPASNNGPANDRDSWVVGQIASNDIEVFK